MLHPYQRPLFVFLLLVIPMGNARGVEPNANTTIRAAAGPSDIVITTTARLAGAIHSLTWNGKEFIDSVDHGRQLQSASNFDCGQEFIPEVFNPTEAGSVSDSAGPLSSSQLLSISAEGARLQTTTQMAFWLKPGENSLGHPARNTTIRSNHLLSKDVRIGYKKLSHAIEYTVTFTVPKGEIHTFAQFEAVTGYMPNEFDRFWTFDLSKHKLLPLPPGMGEQAAPVVFSNAAGTHAMGVFSPAQPSKGFETQGYGRFHFKTEKVNKWNCVFRIRDPKGIAPGDYRYRMFVVVGTLDDVKETLTALWEEFRRF